MSDKIVQHPRRDMKLERDITRSPEAQALQHRAILGFCAKSAHEPLPVGETG